MAATYVVYLVYSGLTILFSFAVGYGFKILKDVPVNAPSLIVAGIGMGLIVLGIVAYIDKIISGITGYMRQRKLKKLLGPAEEEEL